MDNPGTAFIENKDDGLSGCGEGLYKVLLVPGKIDVPYAALGFRIRVFPYAANDVIGPGSSGNGL